MATVRFAARSWTTHTPPPPSPAVEGMVTARVKYRATAASAALPPAPRTSRAVSTARGSSAAAAPANPSTLPIVPGGSAAWHAASAVARNAAGSR
jgi:hypothetical protein